MNVLAMDPKSHARGCFVFRASYGAHECFEFLVCMSYGAHEYLMFMLSTSFGAHERYELEVLHNP